MQLSIGSFSSTVKLTVLKQFVYYFHGSRERCGGHYDIFHVEIELRRQGCVLSEALFLAT